MSEQTPFVMPLSASFSASLVELQNVCESNIVHYSTMFDGSCMSIENQLAFYDERVSPWVAISSAITHTLSGRLTFNHAIEVFMSDIIFPTGIDAEMDEVFCALSDLSVSA